MRPNKILAIGAHPDDVEVGCGGTLAKLIAQGNSIEIIIVTSGEAGNFKIEANRLKEIREREARESANIIGAADVHFLRLPDGLTKFERADKLNLINHIRKIKPDTIFTHARADHFPDHRMVHELTNAAMIGAAGPWYQECPLPPHKISNCYGYEVWHPLNRWQLSVDISNSIDTKMRALKCHRSQLEQIDYVEAIEGLARYRGLLTQNGKAAEVFEVLKSEIHGYLSV